MQRYVHVSVNRQTRIRSRRMNDRNGAVRDVLVEVRENEQKLQHAVALIVVLPGLIVKAGHNGERVGEHCLETDGIDRAARAAALERFVGARERFIEIVVEAVLFGSETLRNLVGARSFAASTRV